MSPLRSLAEWIQDRASVVLERLGHRPSPYRYWAARARAFGVRSVLNIGHTDAEVEAVTRMQREVLFPLLRERLRPGDKRLLDFGCGPGRFTRDLAALIDGTVLGVDPIPRYLDLAPKGERVAYRRLERGVVPAPDASFDVVWICLVLGGILDAGELERTVREIGRVLKPGGLVFLVENTSQKSDGVHWVFRTADAYAHLFPFAALAPVAEYFDLDERMSVLAGRTHE
jgi:SAM-dependent methyltransferase